MRQQLLLYMFVALPLAGAADMSSEELSDRLYERLALGKLAEEIYQPMLSNSRTLASDASLPGKLSATFRSAFTSAMAERFSDEELRALLVDAEKGEDVSVEFVDWLNQAVLDALQAANDAHINKRQSPSGFRIESKSSGDREDGQ